MTQPAYIISSSSISAQHTYDEVNFLNPAINTTEGRFFVVAADYSKYISPVAIRRMSRMLKIGITAGMRALDSAGIKTPDGIIIGTSRGSVTDMEIFLHEMIDLNEQALNPSGFIQSTYNSINGWIAMLSKCHAYNQTYVHRGFSLELCLLDAQMTFAESTSIKHILVGAFDEMTPEYYLIREKIGYYKKNMPDSRELLSHSNTPGSIGGEGAHFFTVSNNAGNAACALHSLRMLHKPSGDDLKQAISAVLSESGLLPGDVDILVSGVNGDSRTAFLNEALRNCFAPDTGIVAFKHLSGEYDVASGFGLWLTDYIFRTQQIPKEVMLGNAAPSSINTVLLCNTTIAGNVSLMLLKKASSDLK